MSFQYDQYLTQHRSNVKRGFDWIAENLPELLVDGFDYGWQIEFAHDKSKDEQDEYEAYDAYFMEEIVLMRLCKIIKKLGCYICIETLITGNIGF